MTEVPASAMTEVFQGVPLGLYMHVPFCATACSFCAFYQERPLRESLDRYLAGMETELALLKLERPVSTVFWGGGTPGLLPAEDLLRLGESMLKVTKGPMQEWTVEVAPSVIKPDKLKALKQLGVSRISMGVQTFKASLLEALGRRHGPAQVYQAYEWAREAGFENINLDLMFALPGQSFEDWREDLEQALALNPEHISTYCLTFEEDTALYAKLMRGETRKRSADEEAEFYLKTWEILRAAGYEQYEVSNFARPGYACQHNVDTWHMAEWVGVGPSAASQYGGWRYHNVPSIDAWLGGLAVGQLNYGDRYALSVTGVAADALIFGLRLNAGVDLAGLGKRFPMIRAMLALGDFFNNLAGEGLLVFEGDFIKLTDAGRLVADGIGLSLLEYFEETE